MANVNSIEYQKIVDTQAGTYTPLQANQLGGRARIATFRYKTAGGGGPAVGDTVSLTKVPKGARVLGIWVQWEAMSSGAGTAGADFGDSGDPDRFVAAENLDAAGTGKWLALRTDNTADVPVLGQNFEYTAETVIQAKVTGEAWAAAKYITGYIVYAVD